MMDPTYDAKKIEANNIWSLAFLMSEIDNDNAPIGWSNYIFLASALLNKYDIVEKPPKRPENKNPAPDLRPGRD